MENNNQPQQGIQNPSSQGTTLPKKPKMIMLAIFVISILTLLAFGIFIALSIHKQKVQTRTSPQFTTLAISPTINPVSTGTPDPKDFTMKVDSVILNPPVKGDPPDNGKQYLEIDVTATNTSTVAEYTPGMFVYQDKSGTSYAAANVKTSSQTASKKIVIPNKKSLFQIKLLPGQTVSGVYLLFQITPGDRGYLVWNNPLNGNKQIFFTLFK